MGGVAVVTDSTAALPAELVASSGVRIVPLQVVLGGRVGAEGVDITVDDVCAALERGQRVSTSRPSPQAFAAAYDDAARAGADAIVSVHLSAALSGTCDAARMASAGAAVPVTVVDSRSTAMGLGFPVLAAGEAAARGDTAAEVAAAAAETATRTTTLFVVDSLDALRRGGRIGQAAALVGTALLVKPLLYVDDGRIALLEKVRTTSRALARLEARVVSYAGSGPVDVAVHHLGARERAIALRDRLRDALPGLASSYVSPVGAAVAAHVGTGALAVVVRRR